MPHDTPPIDAVITWVDGDDPAHKAKLQAYLKTLGRDIPGSAAPTRFRERGELEYCVASILRFAPWVRTIHIVSDNQTPAFLKGDTGRTLANKINLVLHSTIFRGHEDVLPVFSCRPIETVLWRIPDLADRFIYFNDDMMLTGPVQPTDFFRDDTLVLRGHWRRFHDRTFAHALENTRLVQYLKHRNPKPARASHIRMQELSARALGFNNRFFYLPHQPHPAFRHRLKHLFSEHPDWFRFNIEHKLRHPDQLWSFALGYHDALATGRATIDNRLISELVKAEHRYTLGIRTQLNRVSRNARKAFVCIQSLDSASRPIQDAVVQWLDRQIGQIEGAA